MDLVSKAVGAVASRKASSLSSIVYDETERLILSGQLEAGQRVNEQHLASLLGVSRGPVREALRSLERAGLVTAVANLGTFVRNVSNDEAKEMYELRGVLFGFACMRIAGTLTQKQRDRLQESIACMDAAIDAGDGPEYYRLNLEFHDLIMGYAHHGRASQLYESLVKEGHLVRSRALTSVAAMRESNDEHKQVLDAILSGDKAGARAVAEEHHMHGNNRWLDTLG